MAAICRVGMQWWGVTVSLLATEGTSMAVIRAKDLDKAADVSRLCYVQSHLALITTVRLIGDGEGRSVLCEKCRL